VIGLGERISNFWVRTLLVRMKFLQVTLLMAPTNSRMSPLKSKTTRSLPFRGLQFLLPAVLRLAKLSSSPPSFLPPLLAPMLGIGGGAGGGGEPKVFGFGGSRVGPLPSFKG
jgi:hypothetical protein